MCDYSLMALPNRLAVCGEELVVHRFESSAVGLASVSDLCIAEEARRVKPKGFWQTLKWLLNPPPPHSCTAVCIPPGAELQLRDIPKRLQQELQLHGDQQEVVFTQTSTHANFRDAVRFTNGVEILLQQLQEGQRVSVLSLGSAEEDIAQLERTMQL